MADGGAKVGSEGLFIEDDERKEDRSESSVEGGETVNWDMAAASFLTGSMARWAAFPVFEWELGLGMVMTRVLVQELWKMRWSCCCHLLGNRRIEQHG